MAVTEAFDRLGFAIGDIKPVDDNRFDSIKIFIGDKVATDGNMTEPAFAATPLFVGFDEPVRLDPKRIGLTWEVPRRVRSGVRPLSPLVAFLVHLLPFLLLVTWPTAANDGPAVIPVQLVIVEPPPPPPPSTELPPETKPPPQGRLASEEMGDVNPKTNGAAPTAAPPAPGPKQPNPNETQTAAATAPPPPLPPPKPAPPKEHSPVQLPKPSGIAAPKAPEPPNEASHAAKFAGPAASRDEYLAYLVTLTRQHLDLLPLSVVGTRRGETVVSVTVQSDGTISHLAISHGSGYPDIDQRIEQMVAAVRKFPPVPQWFQGNTIELDLRLRFPDALQRD